MTDDLATRFLAAHRPGEPLVMPNAWDIGSAKLFASLGFAAIATTSSGFAAIRGRRDGSMPRDEVLAHAAELAAPVDVPVSADLEDGYGATLAEVTETMERAAAVGLAGCSIEDAAGGAQRAVLPARVAAERVEAAAAACHGGPRRLVLTARAENHLYGVDDLDDTIARLQAYGAAGADVLFAPGLRAIEDIARVVAEVPAPVNVLLSPTGPTIPELAEVGVARVSVGGAFHSIGLGAVVAAAEELRGAGPYTFWATAGSGRAARDASVD